MTQDEFNRIIDKEIISKALYAKNPALKTSINEKIKRTDIIMTVNACLPSGLEQEARGE